MKPVPPKGPRYTGPRGPHARDRAHAKKGRLPDGSYFEVQYHAGRQQWEGFLHIPSMPRRVFRSTAAGVFHLLSLLDDAYRAALAAEAAAAKAGEGGVS